jgi:hypothetical protein
MMTMSSILNHDDDDNNNSIRTSITLTVIKVKIIINLSIQQQVKYLKMLLNRYNKRRKSN